MSSEGNQSNVRKLPSSGLATSNAEVAEELRALAKRIETGQFGEVQHAITVINGGPLLGCVAAGRPLTGATLIGLLTTAIHRACWKADAYPVQAGKW